MAASMHDEQGGSARTRGAAARHAGGGRSLSVIRPDIGPAQRLLTRGAELRFRAPELAMVFGERAAALAEAAGSERLWAHAEGLSVFARVRLGQRADVVNRAVAVLRTAEADGYTELAAQMRVELALCARSVGVPLTGLAALRPVLGEPELSASCRAMAMVQLVGCMAPLGRRKMLERALAEADDLVVSAPDLLDADRVLLRVMVCSRTASSQRRYGDLAACLESAQRGLHLLEGLEPAGIDGVQLRARLVLDMVCALLDRGDLDQAAARAAEVMAEPPRASAFGPLGWLRLAVATRIHLPAGETDAAGRLVREALHGVQRHDLTWISARLWLELAHIEEAAGRDAEALRCLRESRRNEHAYGRIRRQALGLLTGEFGRGEQHVVEIPQVGADGQGSGLGVAPRQRRAQESMTSGPASDTTAAGPGHGDGSPSAQPAEPQPTEPQPAEPEPVVSEPRAVEPPTEPEPARPEPMPSRPALNLPRLNLPGPMEPTLPWPADEPAGERPPETTPAPYRPAPYRPAAYEPEEPRHRAGDGAAARSVLERLGVNVGSGGRRRAAERGPEPTAPELTRPEPARPEPTGPERTGPELTEPTGPEPAEKRHEPLEPPRLDSLLAVFSNWTEDDDAGSGVIAPRVRHRRHEAPADGESVRANGRRVNGEDGPSGRHRNGV